MPLTRAFPPFRAEHVGSLLRPPRLKQARIDRAKNKISAEELRAIENEEIMTVIQKQKSCGLRSITDGEFRRAWWHFDFLEQLTGIEGYHSSKGLQFHSTQTKTYGIRVTSPIDFNENNTFLNDFSFLKACLDNDNNNGYFVAKQTIPSPNMLMHLNIRQNPIYVSLEDYCHDLAKAYKKAINAFYQAGCRYLQLDDVFWAYLVNDKSRQAEEDLGTNIDYLIDLCANVLVEALADKPKDLVIAIHICRGNFLSDWIYSGSYSRISKALFSIKEIDGFFLEFDDNRSGSLEVLHDVTNPNAQVVLGLITSKTPELENPELIHSKVMEATKYLPLRQLCLSPQCGFASTEEGNKLTETQQWNKLKLVIDIAQSIWRS